MPPYSVLYAVVVRTNSCTPVQILVVACATLWVPAGFFSLVLGIELSHLADI